MGKYVDYAKGENLKNRMPLWIKPDHKLDLAEVMGLMRDHYENTPLTMMNDMGGGPFQCGVRWRPMTWKVDSVNYFHERATSTQQTGWEMLCQSRSWLPNPIGGVFWFGVDDSYTSVFTPFYSSITEVPYSFAVGNGSMMEFSETSAFWTFNQVSNFAYTRYSDMVPEIQLVQKELENKYISFNLPSTKLLRNYMPKIPNKPSLTSPIIPLPRVMLPLNAGEIFIITSSANTWMEILKLKMVTTSIPN